MVLKRKIVPAPEQFRKHRRNRGHAQTADLIQKSPQGAFDQIFVALAVSRQFKDVLRQSVANRLAMLTSADTFCESTLRRIV